jgi:exodeoxyribonuclease VII small subunit
MVDDSKEDSAGTEDGGDLSLEARLRRLEEIVGQLETEELELDKALALFEEGVGHVKDAEKTLSAAELRVKELLGEGDELRTRPLEEEE